MPVSTPDTIGIAVQPVRIGGDFPPLLPLGFGGSWFVPYAAPGEQDARLRDAIDAAYEGGVRHFDTAGGYGDGHSEEIYADFLAGKRSGVFLASKADPVETTAQAMMAEVDASLRRLRTDYLDLYYIHWPHAGVDMRPRMEGLEHARRQGKIRAVGVSNFSVAQMRQVQEIGRIDAHQLGYNLLWRHAEKELIPFCRQHGISVVTYSTLAHGILTGKFGRVPDLRPSDQRHNILPFRADIWPHVYDGVGRLKAIAAELGRPLQHLAIRWTIARPGVASVLIGARSRAQAEANVGALSGEMPDEVFDRMTAVSDEIMRHVPDEGNLFNHYP